MNATAGLVNLVVAVLGLAMLAAAIFVAFRGSYNKARLEALREDNNDLRARIGDLDRTVAQGEHDKAALTERVHHVEQENELLKEMVLQRADVTAVGQKLDSHHHEAMIAWSEMTSVLERIAHDVAGE